MLPSSSVRRRQPHVAAADPENSVVFSLFPGACMEQPNDPKSALLVELNDLLQLDHDAVQAYTLAIDSLSDEGHQRTLMRYRGDHQRHIVELSRLVRELGGEPVDLPHLPTGAFKLAVQAAAAAGGDRATLLAYKSNERQVTQDRGGGRGEPARPLGGRRSVRVQSRQTPVGADVRPTFKQRRGSARRPCRRRRAPGWTRPGWVWTPPAPSDRRRGRLTFVPHQARP